ncbi:Spx/MgsR family RNA polymerase-binding regulatory protein [Lactococcus garvieae]|uniref:Arsenate reductase-like protein n=1 Tax=Lactococcus garvieae DCC43 TaxID=1231377 RepID=K2QAB7_9LACT|nr:Spx/MgsR family RNA polymerase-binding regulatory protein [Lactococcus garvieae]EKF50467.1 Arsenate reductase-like protein [Lactococcus garvieae DCC43]QPS71938.1 transcriptional regulator Spx [Lactococcus garvieae]
MIKLYTATANSSSQKVRKWLKDHQLEYQEIDLSKEELTKEEVLAIFSLTEEGSEDVITRRGKAIKSLKEDFYSLTIKELIQAIIDNPMLLRQPLIIDNNHLQVGYHEEDIRKFLPRDVRKVMMEDFAKRRNIRVNQK